MPLSKNIIEKDEAEELAVNYSPNTFGSQISEQAMDYVINHDSRGDFRVDKIVSEFVGIEELEKQTQQKEVAKQALALNQDIQEKAYQEAYELGLKEGQETAYQEEKQRIEDELSHIRSIIDEMKKIKGDLMRANEKQIVNLCFYMAKRLLMKEVGADPEYVQTLIKKTLEMAQSEEDVTIRMSPEDKVWVDQHKESVFKEIDLDPLTKFEEDSDVIRGGIIIETNHGVIDATVEQRLEKLEKIVTSQT